MEKTTYGNGLVRNTTFDALTRPLSSSVGKIDLPVVFSEQTAWTPRSLKAGIARADENGLGKVFRYDGASRVVGVARRPLALLDVANNSVPSAELIASAKEAEEFAYDAAQNLLRQKERKDESETVTETPPDESGRNRPASIGGRELEWDANGNLRKKDNLRFAYDWRNRLSKVTRADNGNLVAIYSYDVFNRRVEKEVGGQTYGYAWDGWNQIEDSLNGPNEVRNRRVYGLGLDNALRMDFDLDGSGGPDAQYVPVYDGIGNLVALTNAAGKPVERYEYSAYGKQKIFVDATPPQINQIRKVGSTFLLEMSEEVSLTEIQRQIAEGEIRLSGTGVGGTYGLTATQPVQEGPLARRRVALTTGADIAADQEVTLTIGAATLVDSFLNTAPAADKVLTLDWETEGVLEDHTNPAVQRIAIRSGKLEIDFDETVDATLAAQAILVDGGVVAWTRSASGYQMVADVALTAGSHEVEIGTGAIDLASKGLVTVAEEELSVGTETYVAVFQVPDAREVLASTANNPFGFHGLPRDSETGFLYVRNRYYDLELAIFASSDPLQFVDGPSVYQFVGGDPIGNSDPMGLLINPLAVMKHLTAALDFVSGVAQGIAGSVTFGLLPGTEPEHDDTLAQRVGQGTGSALTMVAGIGGGLTSASAAVVTCGVEVATIIPTAGASLVLTPACAGFAAGAIAGAAATVGSAMYMNEMLEKGYQSENSETDPTRRFDDTYDPVAELKKGADPDTVVPDHYTIVRGGQGEMPPKGEKFSGSMGKGVEEAGKGVPHGSIRVTTAGEIRKAGGKVTLVPEPIRGGEKMNEIHVNIVEGGPSTFSELMPNPVPKSGRLQ